MTDWRDRAACTGEDPELFFPPGASNTALYLAQAARAKRVCAACPVREICGEWAVREGIDDGIFGGLDPAQRRARRAEPVTA
jgi:WhiB family redox-sensing transcriptional regulator